MSLGSVITQDPWQAWGSRRRQCEHVITWESHRTLYKLWRRTQPRSSMNCGRLSVCLLYDSRQPLEATKGRGIHKHQQILFHRPQQLLSRKTRGGTRDPGKPPEKQKLLWESMRVLLCPLSCTPHRASLRFLGESGSLCHPVDTAEDTSPQEWERKAQLSLSDSRTIFRVQITGEPCHQRKIGSLRRPHLETQVHGPTYSYSSTRTERDLLGPGSNCRIPSISSLPVGERPWRGTFPEAGFQRKIVKKRVEKKAMVASPTTSTGQHKGIWSLRCSESNNKQ